jgi:hypothetical protein
MLLRTLAKMMAELLVMSDEILNLFISYCYQYLKNVLIIADRY